MYVGIMRYGIFSDIHSNLEALNAVLAAYKDEAVDTYLCIGDLVGYAANPKECIEKVKAITGVIVAGNHDWAAADLFGLNYFSPLAKEAIIWTKGNLGKEQRYFLGSLKLVYRNEDLALVHATLDNPGEFEYMDDEYMAGKSFELMQENICFTGHTHVVGVFIQDRAGRIHYHEDDSADIDPENKYIINVGSVGQPRDLNPKAAYSIYDTEKKNVRIKRVDYDIRTAKNKIDAAGLPEVLGQRLLKGK